MPDAYAVASTRFEAPILLWMLLTCRMTVLREMISSSAIAWLPIPVVTSRSTSIWRGVSGTRPNSGGRGHAGGGRHGLQKIAHDADRLVHVTVPGAHRLALDHAQRRLGQTLREPRRVLERG